MSRLGRLYRSLFSLSNGVRKLGAVRQAGFAQTTVVGVFGGAVAGMVYSVYTHYNINREQALTAAPELQAPEEIRVPDIVPTKKIVGTLSIPNTELTLFQYQTCPFCCKVRAFLDFHGFSYNIVEVDAVLRQSIKWSKYKKVPILLIKNEDGYQQLNDSSVIISILSSYLGGKYEKVSDIVQYYPSVKFVDDEGNKKDEIINKYFLMFQEVPKNMSNERMTEERTWRKWSDDVLVHVLSPNVYRTRDEALQAFNWFAETGDWRQHFPSWEVSLMINVGAYAMWLIGKRLKTKHKLKDDVRLSLYDECNYWMRAIKNKGSEFMGGSKPDLSDLAVYGILSSIEGCDAFQDLLNNTKISKWYYSMKEHINISKGNVAV